MEEILEVVDRKNNVIGLEKRSVIHEKNLLHRSVNLVSVNDQGHVIISKRSPDKDQYPGCWSFIAAGHMKPKENPIDSLLREIHEELRLEVDPEYITVLPAEEKSGNHFAYIYFSKLSKPLSSIRFNKKEVSNIRELKVKDLLKEIKECPESFSPAFVRAFLWLVDNKTI